MISEIGHKKHELKRIHLILSKLIISALWMTPLKKGKCQAMEWEKMCVAHILDKKYVHPEHINNSYNSVIEG